MEYYVNEGGLCFANKFKHEQRYFDSKNDR